MKAFSFSSSKTLLPLAWASAFAVGLGLPYPLPAGAAEGGGLLGAPLGDAEKHADLFTFFNLEETGTTAGAAGARVVSFKPSGPNFRPLVTINVTVDKDGAITQIEALIARSFIEDKTNGVFARDLAKSLLRAGVPAADQEAITDLTNEIEYPPSTDRLVLSARPAPKLPAQPSAGYLAFLGKQKEFEQALSATRLRLENRQAGGDKVLALTVARR